MVDGMKIKEQMVCDSTTHWEKSLIGDGMIGEVRKS
jgi:hypothetical protein